MSTQQWRQALLVWLVVWLSVLQLLPLQAAFADAAPDVTGWAPGIDVYFSKFAVNPETARWARENTTVFVQVAHPAIPEHYFASGKRMYANAGAQLPVGAAVKVFGLTSDAKWAKIMPPAGWGEGFYYIPAGALSEKWPFEQPGAKDGTGYVGGTPWNWTDGDNPTLGEAHRQGQRTFYVRTSFGEIYEGEFLNQRRTYGRSLPVDEAVTVVDITADGRWARIEHAKNGPRYFVPTAVLSPGWTGAVKGQAQVTYTVVKGDTLSRIARHYGVTVDALAAANGIAHPNLIRVGQVLTIPAPQAP